MIYDIPFSPSAAFNCFLCWLVEENNGVSGGEEISLLSLLLLASSNLLTVMRGVLWLFEGIEKLRAKEAGGRGSGEAVCDAVGEARTGAVGAWRFDTKGPE